MRALAILLALAACDPEHTHIVYTSAPDRDAGAETTPAPLRHEHPTCSELADDGGAPPCDLDASLASSVPCDAAVACHWGCWAHSADYRTSGQAWSCQIDGVTCVVTAAECR